MCGMLSRASWRAKLVGTDAAGTRCEPSSSAAAQLALSNGGKSMQSETACEKRKERTEITLRSVFYVADSQRKYFSAGWIRACLLLRCNQTSLRLLWAFKELTGARAIHVEKKKQVLSKLYVNVLMHELFTVSSDNVVGRSLLGVFPVFQQLIYSIDFSSVCLVMPLSSQSAISYEPQGSIFPSGSSCWSLLQHPWIDWLSLCHLYLYSYGLSMLVPCQSPIVAF